MTENVIAWVSAALVVMFSGVVGPTGLYLFRRIKTLERAVEKCHDERDKLRGKVDTLTEAVSRIKAEFLDHCRIQGCHVPTFSEGKNDAK